MSIFFQICQCQSLLLVVYYICFFYGEINEGCLVHTYIIKHILLLSATSVKYEVVPTLIFLQETCFTNLFFSCENIMFRKVRDELEHLLDDEMDMAEMYLTEKLTQQEISEASSRAEVDDPSQTEEDRQVHSKIFYIFL